MVLSLIATACTAQGSKENRNPYSYTDKLKSFSTKQELTNYIRNNVSTARFLGYHAGVMVDEAVDTAEAVKKSESSSALAQDRVGREYSETNVQVEGVDEADIVKSDGQYLYVTTGDKVVIMNAYPADQTRIISEININGYANKIFINDNRLIVMGNNFAQIYDINNKANPKAIKKIETDGGYYDSRMVGNYVYILINTPVRYRENDTEVNIPYIAIDGKGKEVSPSEIKCIVYPDYSYRYTTILAVDLKEDVLINSEIFLTGVSNNIYVSKGNIYLTSRSHPDMSEYGSEIISDLSKVVPSEIKNELNNIVTTNNDIKAQLSNINTLMQDYVSQLSHEERVEFENTTRKLWNNWRREFAKDSNNTLIHKLAVNKDNISYVATGKVPGLVLNQFSMDEHDGVFRIATTTSNWLTEDDVSKNNVYTLDSNLSIVGKLEGLAPNERIYSARFMGEKVYMVTFRQMDPLYVIDLEDPYNPKVLGELKIPGFSSYLHPYDENHLIGIGKEVVPQIVPDASSLSSATTNSEPRLRDLGVKVSLFDVSNPSDPREISNYVVKNNGGYTNSEALRNHKAVLFSREKGILAVPIQRQLPYRIIEGQTKRKIIEDVSGLYVFNISPEGGIDLKGTVTHRLDEKQEKTGIINRSLYIEDNLYTISKYRMKINELKSLKEINNVKF